MFIFYIFLIISSVFYYFYIFAYLYWLFTRIFSIFLYLNCAIISSFLLAFFVFPLYTYFKSHNQNSTFYRKQAQTNMTCSIPATNNSNLKEYIHDQILKDVIEGTLQPNMILHEKKLMEQYGVSRSPVREALIQLCSEGTLCNYPKRGYEVSSITEKEIQDIIHFRIAVECSFLMQCGPNISDETLKKLDEYITDHVVLQANGLTALQHWTSNMKFHLLLFSSYDNPYTYQKLKEAMTIQTRFYAQKRSKKWQTPVFTDRDILHQAVLDYLKQKNYTMASSILKADIEDRSAV